MAKLPLAPFEKILKESGDVRVSEKAAAAFTEVIGEIAAGIAKDAAELARHAGRKTIMADDVKLAHKKQQG